MIVVCHPQTCLGVRMTGNQMSLQEEHRKGCERYNIPGHAHELTFSCYRRQPFLSDERFCRFLAKAVARAMAVHRCDLWAYVFMPEHVHLLVHPRKFEYSISPILHSIKQSASRRVMIYARRHSLKILSSMATGQKDPAFRFWQDGGGFDRNVFKFPTMVHVVKYIHNNPVRRGLVAQPEEWMWSSARDWAGLGLGPISIDISTFPPA